MGVRTADSGAQRNPMDTRGTAHRRQRPHVDNGAQNSVGRLTGTTRRDHR